jgi:hypothetical protein
MAQDPTQVRVGITGKILVAPVGSTEPTDVTSAWAAAWVDIGLIDDDSMPSMTPNRETAEIGAWQKKQPVRIVETSRNEEWKITPIQRTGTVLKRAFGGGTVTALGGGLYKFTPPSAGSVDEMAYGIEVVDGTIIDRYVLRRGMVSDTGEIVFAKDDATKFPLTIRSLEPSAGTSWELVASNDAALAS